MLKIIVQEGPSGIAFNFHGELDMSTTQIMLDSFQKITDQHQSVVFDLSKLMFIDSTGVGHLLFESRKLQEKNHKLIFQNMNEEIQMVFDLLGVPSILGEESFVSNITS